MHASTVSLSNLHILEDGDAIAAWVAQDLLSAALSKNEQPFTVALSGGTTPKRLLRKMAEPDYVSRFPWNNTHLFFGDERYVPWDDPASNYRMSRENLLDKVPVPPNHVHAMPTDVDPSTDAARYEVALRRVYGAAHLKEGRNLFDVVLLGMGTDGHTASLFPHQSALKEEERWVVPAFADVEPMTRLTLTYPAIRSSGKVIFMIEGEAKAAMLARVRQNDPELPASHVQSVGKILFIVDKAAAGAL